MVMCVQYQERSVILYILDVVFFSVGQLFDFYEEILILVLKLN